MFEWSLTNGLENNVQAAISHAHIHPGHVNAVGRQAPADVPQKVEGIKFGRAEIKRRGDGIDDEGILLPAYLGEVDAIIEDEVDAGVGGDVKIMIGHPVKILQNHWIDFNCIDPVEKRGDRARSGTAPHTED